MASAKAAQKNFLSHRKNSFELFGYDLMIDEMLDVWLLEVNSVP